MSWHVTSPISAAGEAMVVWRMWTVKTVELLETAATTQLHCHCTAQLLWHLEHRDTAGSREFLGVQRNQWSAAWRRPAGAGMRTVRYQQWMSLLLCSQFLMNGSEKYVSARIYRELWYICIFEKVRNALLQKYQNSYCSHIYMCDILISFIK